MPQNWAETSKINKLYSRSAERKIKKIKFSKPKLFRKENFYIQESFHIQFEI